MNIIQIIPGSGGSFYCGNCLRDSKYVHALRKEGHKVVKIPMYLPLFSDEHDLNDVPIFYGAISIYLKQLYPVFRRSPKWFDNLLNSKPMMRLAASMAGSTRAKGLEDMTISMLLGEKGKQSEELDHMVNWIADNCNPDIIHISNALLLGLAKRLKEKIGVPVVCSLQDEDVWVDVMLPPFRDRIWNLMNERAADVDAFVAVSNFFAGTMKERMKLPDDKVHTLYLGVDYEDYQFILPSRKKRNIGYLSRICRENGFDIVVDAFIELKRNPLYDDVNLIATGGHTGDDVSFLKEQKRKIKENGLSDMFHILPEFEGNARHEFFRQVAMMSVPVHIGEAFGMYLLESLASGVPVVQPALGAFPEIINKTEGGIVYSPNLPEQLSKAWEGLLNDQDKSDQLALKGYEGTKKYFNIHNHAGEMILLFENLRKQGNKNQ